MTPRAVFDCMIYLQAATGGRGASAESMRLAEFGRIAIFVNAAILFEVRDVFARPRIRKKFPILTPEYVNRFMRKIAGFVNFSAASAVAGNYCRDPKDEKYLNLAIAANARYVVSRDNDLLDLMTPNDPDGIVFRTAYPAIEILEPAAFLQALTPAE